MGNAKFKLRAYESPVRPQLEYASAAWSPYYENAINKLEQVQRNAARFVTGDYRRSTNSAGLVHALGWDPLEQRRLMAQALLFYKLHNGLVNINMPPEFTLLNRVTRHHNLHYRQLQTNVLSYSYSFSSESSQKISR